MTTTSHAHPAHPASRRPNLDNAHALRPVNADAAAGTSTTPTGDGATASSRESRTVMQRLYERLSPRDELEWALAEVAAVAANRIAASGTGCQDRDIDRLDLAIRVLACLRRLDAVMAKGGEPLTTFEEAAADPLIEIDEAVPVYEPTVPREDFGDDVESLAVADEDDTPANLSDVDDLAEAGWADDPFGETGGIDPWRDRLTSDPVICEHSPVVKGTGITVTRVISMLVDGLSWAEVMRDHPELDARDIRACLAYSLEQDGFVPAG